MNFGGRWIGCEYALLYLVVCFSFCYNAVNASHGVCVLLSCWPSGMRSHRGYTEYFTCYRVSLHPSSPRPRSSTKIRAPNPAPTSNTSRRDINVTRHVVRRGSTYRDSIWWPPCFSRLLDALERLGRSGFVIVKLICLDAHTHDVPSIDVHPVRKRRVE